MRRNSVSVALFFVCYALLGQNTKQDSLWNVYNNASQSDTNRLKAIGSVAKSYLNNNPDSAITLASLEIQLAEKTKFQKYQAAAFNTIGNAYSNKGEYSKALDYYLMALKIRKELKDNHGIGPIYANMGNIYYLKADYPKALDYYLKGLKIAEASGDKRIMGNCFTNIGTLYFDQKDYPKALEYGLNALKVLDEIGDKDGIQNCYNNIAAIYDRQSNTQKALEYYLKSLKISEEIGNKDGMGFTYANIGNVYFKKDSFEKAKEYYMEALLINKETGEKSRIGSCYNNLSGLYLKLLKYDLSILYCDSSLKITKEIGDINEQIKSYLILTDVYSKMGRYKEAFYNQGYCKLLNDSIFNSDKNKQLGDLKTGFAVEKKEAEMNIIAKEEKKRESTIIYAVAGTLFIVIVFSVFLYRRFKITQRQNVVIEKQKEEVLRQKNVAEELRGVAELERKFSDEKRREILESIHYAKRIQDALLKVQELSNPHLPEHFVFFKPKDIVSGDFYWTLEKENNYYLAVADCTGHGVPGAFLTMLGTSFLIEINSVPDLLTPAEILNQLRKRFIKELGQTGKYGENKDGMDISMVRINLKTRETQWAGANNAVYFVSGNELTEIKPDKQPISYADNLKPFTNHTFQLQKDDSIYLFSDGFEDQFGGPLGKKFMSKQMKGAFLSISHLGTLERKERLNAIFEQWKGGLSQIDDVCIVGIKV